MVDEEFGANPICHESEEAEAALATVRAMPPLYLTALRELPGDATAERFVAEVAKIIGRRHHG